jgi:putative transposase
MKRSNFTDAQIAFILRQAEEGASVEEVGRQAGMSQQTCHRWRKTYGGLMPSEMKRLKQAEEESGRLKRIVADLSLDRRCCRASSAESSEACPETIWVESWCIG